MFTRLEEDTEKKVESASVATAWFQKTRAPQDGNRIQQPTHTYIYPVSVPRRLHEHQRGRKRNKLVSNLLLREGALGLDASGSGYLLNCEPTRGRKYAESSIIFIFSYLG
jgi:hypothetical protein